MYSGETVRRGDRRVSRGPMTHWHFLKQWTLTGSSCTHCNTAHAQTTGLQNHSALLLRAPATQKSTLSTPSSPPPPTHRLTKSSLFNEKSEEEKTGTGRKGKYVSRRERQNTKREMRCVREREKESERWGEEAERWEAREGVMLTGRVEKRGISQPHLDEGFRWKEEGLWSAGSEKLHCVSVSRSHRCD